MRNTDALYDLIQEVTGYSPRDNVPAPVTGAGGGGGKGGGGAAQSAPDTLFSTATVRMVDLLCEGPIKGVRGGLKGVYLNDVPVQNEDSTFNFKGIGAEFREGWPEQSYMAGYPDVQSPTNVGIKVNQPTPVTVSVTETAADRVRVTVQIPALFLSKNDGSVSSNSVSYRVLVRYSGGPWVNELGDQTITGKTTSGYLRSHEISLPRNPNGASGPWSVQLVRISPDTDDFNNKQDKYTNQSDIIFHSITNIVDAKFSYPHSAVVGITAQASSFGSSMPGRRYLVDGAIMPVPSNYDPETRTYTGIWDGTFKHAFSNNPAWALYLLLSNKRFGLGDYVDEGSIDKWSLYDIGRYCDQLVPDGKGGTEPRAVFNGVIETQQDAFELLQLIAQVFRGLVYWSAGTVTAAQDRPRDPVMLLTEANVVDGEFSYSSSSIRARHTVALVRWHDPDNLYKPTIEVVEDAEGIARYGYNPTRVDLLGCTSRGQAHRAGRWILFTELEQTQVLAYRAGLDHATLRPGDVVAAMDPSLVSLDPDADMGGRLLAGNTLSDLKLDHEIVLQPNTPYSVSVTMPNGDVVERPIINSAGRTASLSLGAALPQVPDPAAVYVVYGPTEPRQFSVVSLYEQEPHIYAVTALQYEPGKFAAIDEGAEFEPTNFTDFPNKVEPPLDLDVRESQYSDLGVVRQALTLSWRPANPFNVSGYYVTAIRPTGAVINLPRTASVSTDFIDVEPGTWTFLVTTIGLNGKASQPAALEYTVTGWQGQAAATVTGLQVRGGGATFAGRSCTMQWANTFPEATSPYPVTNVVYVYDASTNTLLHRELLTVGQTEWTYDYNVNVNEGGPRRTFRVAVTARAATGMFESAPASLTVSNPPPERITPVLSATSEMLFVELPPVSDADFAGYLVWVSETANINPVTAKAYEVTGGVFTFAGQTDKTYYVRAAAYDAFGKNPTELNVSFEQSKKLTILLFDPTAPSVPGKPTLSANVAETAPDGTITSKITIAWPAVNSSNLGRYEVFIAEGNDPADSAYVGGRFTSGTTTAFAGLMPGRAYSFKVRTESANGFAASQRSEVLVVTAALNTAPPGNPASFAVNASFEAANLSWVNPTDKDLRGIEVWVSDNNLSGTLFTEVTAPGAYFRYPMAGQATKWFWLRAVNTSGVASGFIGPIQATSPLLQAGQLAGGIIDETKFSNSIAATSVVSALPATKTTPFVTLTSDGKSYRWDAALGRYTASVPATDISGKVSAAQIDTITASQISNQIQASQLSVIPATQITGQMTDAQIAAVAAAKVSGELTAATMKTAQLLGTIAKTQITDGAISTPKLEAGAVTASKLDVISTNIAYNPDGAQGARGWSAETTMSHVAPVTLNTDYSPFGYTAFVLNSNVTLASTTSTSYSDLVNGPVDQAGAQGRYPVTAGTTYQISVCISAHRCTGRVIIQWFNASGASISYADTASRVTGTTTAATKLHYSAYPKSRMMAKAPAGATSARVFFRMDAINGDAPYLFVSALMFAAVKEGATEFDNYVAPGTTRIEGGNIITRTLSAQSIIAGTISADELGVDSVVAGKIKSGAVETRHMTAGTIDAGVLTAKTIVAGLLAVNSVVGENIQADSITAGKILLADTTNMLRNGYFLNGSAEGWNLVGDGVVDYVNPATDSSGPYRLTGTARHPARSHWIDVTPGDWLYFSCDVYNGHSAGNAGIYIEYYTKSLTNGIGRYAAFTGVRNAWTRVEGRDQVPNGVQQVRVLPYADTNDVRCWWTRFQVRRANNASLMVDGAVTARTINATEVFGNKGVFDSLQAGAASFGGLTAGSIAAGAISADKLGVGLNTGNLIWNSEGTVDSLPGPAAGTQPNVFCDMLPDWKVNGAIRSIRIHHPNPTNGAYTTCDIQTPAAAGGYTWEIPVQGGKRYEFSCYVSVHGPCRAYIQTHFNDGTGFFGANNSNIMNTNGRQGAPGDDWRCKIMVDSPATAVRVLLRLVVEFQGTTASWGFFSGFYLGVVPDPPAGKPRPTAFSEWTLQSRTILSGGQISTNSLHANKIVGGTITSDQIQAGSINVDRLNADQLRARIIATDGLTADKIVVGSTRLNNWVSAGDTTRINGGSIAANTIEARSLKISSRQINLVGITFEAERDGNGNITGFFKWSAGHVLYQDAAGAPQAKSIPAARVAMNNAYWYVWFDPRAANLGFAQDNWDGIYNDPEVVLVATVSAMTGISVLVGSTIIDGTRIQTQSIVADKIATNAIQARHITANEITGDKIRGGQIVAGHIVGGQINGDHLATNSVYSQHIVAGHVTADKLNVGVGGKNQIANSDFSAFTPGFAIPGLNWATSIGGQSGTLVVNNSGSGWEPPGMRSLQLNLAGNPPAGHIADIYLSRPSGDANGGMTDKWPVQGGQRYEVSGYVSAHRCRAYMTCGFYDASNNQLSGGTTNVNEQVASSGPLVSWFRCGMFVNAPSNAAYMKITLRMEFTGANIPYTFWTGLYMGQATAYQFELSPWSDGSWTSIEGGAIRTGSITADRLSVGTLSALSANLGTVTAGVARSADNKFVIDFNSKYIGIWD